MVSLTSLVSPKGVDKVISVDLQRPGQGHEACFFKATLPAETISTNDLFVDYFRGQFQENGTTGVAVRPFLLLCTCVALLERRAAGSLCL